jgi:hypothetical protein
VQAAHASGLPARLLSTIDGARTYAEGRGVRFPIRAASEIRHMETLVDIKLAN